ncbi:MAG: bifunctional methylenetetrahydrofolate dehydrogenase/methenyltetrahydrofolate cyclohydrolase FolD [Bradymonadia bacterium]
MSATLISGKVIAAQVRAEAKDRAEALKARGITPGLAVVLAGDDPASAVYVRNKGRVAEKVGINARTIRLPDTVSAEEVLAQVDALNADDEVDGILVQLPLPSGISAEDTQRVLERVDPAKDVDGFHPDNLGRLAAGNPKLVPCTPSGCMRMLKELGTDLSGKRAVVIGRSVIVGRPMALLLLGANATVTICHSRTVDLAERVREADIVVAAVGRREMVKGDWIKPGAVVIDVGINRNDEGKLVGDVAFAECAEVASAITPVPGGVGPMTIAQLMMNVCIAAEARRGGDHV